MATKPAVSPPMPIAQPTRNAMLVGRGLGVCSIRMPGMTDSGESVMTSASGMSSGSSEVRVLVTRRTYQVRR